MFSVVIMSNQNGGKSQKQSGIVLRRLRMRLLIVIENFSPPIHQQLHFGPFLEHLRFHCERCWRLTHYFIFLEGFKRWKVF